MNNPGHLKRLHSNAVWILILLVAAGFFYRGPGVAVSILIGGLLALLNHYWMVAGVNVLLGTPTPSGRSLSMLKYVLRLLLILGTLFAMIHFSFFSLVGAIAGLSILVLAGMLEALIQLVEQLKGRH